jgi:hypothetical protein
MDLLLGGVEGQVANVESGCIFESIFLILLVLLCFLIIVPALLILYRSQLGIRMWVDEEDILEHCNRD